MTDLILDQPEAQAMDQPPVRVYYSIETKGFYPDAMTYEYLPPDLVEMPLEDYQEYITGKEGYMQVFDEKGPRLEKIPAADPNIPVEPTTAERIQALEDKVAALTEKVNALLEAKN